MAPPQTTKQRNSSIELYRIIATFTVLIVHFNGWFVGGIPEKYDIDNPSLFRTGQMVIEAATCICVNMFLIISGYFSIKLKLQSVIKICSLLVLIYVPFYILDAIYSNNFQINALIGQFFVISRAGYFIQCYLMLMFLSPVLNAFINHYGKKVVKWVLFFFAIEIWFGCIKQIEYLGYNHGYSVIHFVLMYMLARCIRLYESELLREKWYFWIIGYILCTFIICVMYIMGIKFCWDYSNPVVVISSIFSFMPFLYFEYHNKFINWVAGGTLAVYIIQVTNPIHGILVKIDNYLLNTYSYSTYLLLAFSVILLTFLLSVIYGRCCDCAIKPLLKRLNIELSGKFEYK